MSSVCALQTDNERPQAEAQRENYQTGCLVFDESLGVVVFRRMWSLMLWQTCFRRCAQPDNPVVGGDATAYCAG
eukprot:5656334-Amphidinium_carterae.1